MQFQDRILSCAHVKDIRLQGTMFPERCSLVCQPSENMAMKQRFLACLPSENVAKKQCFLVCPPSGSMATKQCFLVCPPSWKMAWKKRLLVCPPSENMTRKQRFLVCPPSENMARKQCFFGLSTNRRHGQEKMLSTVVCPLSKIPPYFDRHGSRKQCQLDYLC